MLLFPLLVTPSVDTVWPPGHVDTVKASVDTVPASVDTVWPAGHVDTQGEPGEHRHSAGDTQGGQDRHMKVDSQDLMAKLTKAQLEALLGGEDPANYQVMSGLFPGQIWT